MTEFILDMTPGGSPPIIHASQGDIGRAFRANLYYKGEPMTLNAAGFGSLTDDEVAVNQVRLRGKKPDGTVFDKVLSYATSASYVSFETFEQLTIVPGPVECEILLLDSGNKVASANFFLMVEGEPYDETAASESIIESAESIVHDWLNTNGVTLTLDRSGVVRLTT